MTWNSLKSPSPTKPGMLNRISIEKTCLRIRIDGELMKKLGWSRGDRIRISVGDTEHTGLVRLESASHGWTLFAPSGGKKRREPGAVLKIVKHVALVNFPPGAPDQLSAQFVQMNIVNGGLEFRVPWVKPRVETVEDAIARGVPIKKGPSFASQRWANPVRERAHPYSGGRVR